MGRGVPSQREIVWLIKMSWLLIDAFLSSAKLNQLPPSKYERGRGRGTKREREQERKREREQERKREREQDLTR